MFQRKQTVFRLVNFSMILALMLSACARAAAPPSQAAPEIASSTHARPPLVEPTITQAPAPVTAVVEGQKNAFGVVLPADAAPPDQQYLRIISSEGATTDFAVSVYKRCFNCDILSTPLVRLNKNFEFIPAGALSWDVSVDGRTWTFHLDPALKWSDGNPVTADDIVFTFQYQADPKHAWDFTSFWSDLQNWNDAVTGEIPLNAIGVKKVDDYTVQFITTDVSPYFLSKALYVRPLSKAAFEKYGPNYDNDPKTSVSSSPWLLEEWTTGKQMVFGPNKNYTGKLKPYLEKLIIVFGNPLTDFQGYLNNQVDFAQNFSPADRVLINADPHLNSEYHPSYGDFRTFYLGFNTLERPFSNIKVRWAFAKAIDRDSLMKNVIGRQGIAAYSLLMPGFPDSTSNQLMNEEVNKFDPAVAQRLLAAAGYPNGQGFPAIQLWLRNESPLNLAVGQAVAGMIKQNLRIDVQLNNADARLFTGALNAHRLQFYMLSDAFNYLDPANMLSPWVSGGQHAWENDQFDQLVKGAALLTGDPSKRDQMFKGAEQVLVDDAGGVFLYHVTPGDMYKPYVKGEELEPDKIGLAAWHWPGLEDIGMLMPTVYISKDVVHYRR
jgi:ABC-type transport system substrate-binding protein